ncbi:Protoheme IX farnesyltransferase, mitochondrial [Toxocara canis]|uniref:Protoheme IX farnesyltransferase, mitochondrial n=1 Tax=Toxocara canis TaxID=6265 RepID=A0A0B2W492_TOXCA|nr:Protoheme IX farnesyltransferase, mitochondrial [Toxocara canis]
MLSARLPHRLCGMPSSAFTTNRASVVAVRRVRPDVDAPLSSPDLKLNIWKRCPTSNAETIPLGHCGVNLILTDAPIDQWRRMKSNHLIADYFQLSKARLTALITSTAIGGYMMTPETICLASFLACASGTALLSACANACNHLLEAPYDAQMKRTQSRLLVVHRFSPLHAVGFASVAALAGVAVLSMGCNALTAALGLLNVFLYAGVYTPMKRHSIGCTWAGAVVGAIPPVMGYTAATGTVQPAALILAAILYSWQFPHFNSLSWNLRGDYSRAGYRIMCVTNEALCRRTTLRHSLALCGICSIAAPYSNLTTWSFAFDSLPVNAFLVYFAMKFYTNPDAKTSRALFRYSLLYLPLIMVLMVVSKYGQSSTVLEACSLHTDLGSSSQEIMPP